MQCCCAMPYCCAAVLRCAVLLCCAVLCCYDVLCCCAAALLCCCAAVLLYCRRHTCKRASCDDSSQAVASLSEQVCVSMGIRVRVCVYGVWPAGRGLQSQLLQLLAMKSSAGIARRGPPCQPNTKDTNASAHPAMNQARKLPPCLDKCAFQKICVLACVSTVFGQQGEAPRASCCSSWQ